MTDRLDPHTLPESAPEYAPYWLVALRACDEALAKHDLWCGHKKGSPGDPSVNRAERLIRGALRREEAERKAEAPPETGHTANFDMALARDIAVGLSGSAMTRDDANAEVERLRLDPHTLRDAALVHLHATVKAIVAENVYEADGELYCRSCLPSFTPGSDLCDLHAPDCLILKLTQALGTFTPRLAAPVGWQPIETAPKDRLIIGALIDGRRIHRVSEMKHNGLAFYTTNGGALPQMTHWMPLPEVPHD